MGRTAGRTAAALLGVLILCPTTGRADEPAYFSQRVSELKLTEGSLESSNQRPDQRRSWTFGFWPTYVVLDGPGEAYWSDRTNPKGDIENNFDSGKGMLCARAKPGADLAGWLFFFDRSTWTYHKARFKIPAGSAKPEFHDAFYFAKARHYYNQLDERRPGGAWFRHQLRTARSELGRKEPEREPSDPRELNAVASKLDNTYSLFSGGRAVSENLQLDRSFNVVQKDKSEVPVDTVPGITVAEIDWTKLIAGKQPQLDPLAESIPADQHVVFFPSFAALLALADEADRQGTPVLEATEPRAEDFGVAQRYRRQLGLQTSALARMLGPQVIASVALTGGDPYFRLGTDVAVLLEAKGDVGALRTLVAGQIALNTATTKGVVQASDKLLGVPYQQWLSPGREVSSYLAVLGRTVVVTNSPAQLRRLIETTQRKRKAIASLDEYRYFRDRYPRGDAAETALLFLSDAAIRRWCGPQWRIADSRRTRDLAVLSEAQAAQVPQLVAGKIKTGKVESNYSLSDASTIELAAEEVYSPTVGRLGFLTPIVERPPTRVSHAEAAAYTLWRRGYESNFRWAFDPIALRMSVERGRLAADLTVMPLVFGSEYATLVAVSRPARLSADSGDPHDATAQLIMAINTNSEPMKQWSTMAGALAPQIRFNPLGWLGKSVSVYCDASPLWREFLELKTAEQRQTWVEGHEMQMPIAVNIEISSTLKAVAFIAGLRAFVEQTAPGMLQWEDIRHGDQAYVKISPTERGAQDVRQLAGANLAIYYALTAEALTISPDEGLIKRVLDRAQARHDARNRAGTSAAASAGQEKPPTAEHPSQSGKSLALEVKSQALELVGALFSDDYRIAGQRLAWGNIPILNEWKRRFPQHDPVQLHEQLWGVRLICPGGGKYVWNEAWRTMESTVYGHPAEPKLGPAGPPVLEQIKRVRMGLTFEEHGLRGQVELLRKEPEPSR